MAKGLQLVRDGWVDTLQLYYNMFYQSPAAELLPLAAERGVGIITAVPFAWGALTGKYTSADQVPEEDVRRARFAGASRPGTPFPSLADVEELRQIIAPTGLPMAAAALRFVMAHPAVSVVIPGARTLEQLEQNVASADGPTLPQEIYDRIVARFGPTVGATPGV
jgi:aryl-alcohol dehydrogenase-like predicted oxidoreductase